MVVRSSHRLLERDDEDQVIAALLRTASSGHGCLLVVEGAAGIGKSTLLAQVRAQALDAEYRTLSARAGEGERDYAFGVVRQLFEPLVEEARADERSKMFAGPAALATPLFETTSLVRSEAAESPFAMLHGLYWLVANLAQSKPVLIAVDDLHWADTASLRWFDYMVRRLEGIPLLAALTVRQSPHDREHGLLARFELDPDAVVLRPRPLSKASVAILLEEEFGKPPGAAFVGACQAASGGNPLFVQALLRTVADEGIEPSDANASAVTALQPHDVTNWLNGMLLKLPRHASDVLAAVSLLGEAARIPSVADITGLRADMAAGAVDELVAADLLHGFDPPEFVHPVVRTAAYAQLPPGLRSRWHQRAAELLIAHGSSEQAAGHLFLAPSGSVANAAAVLRGVAERSLNRGAPREAANYLRRALEERLEVEERAEILRMLGEAELNTDISSAVEHLAASAALFHDPRRKADASLLLFRALEYLDKFVDAAAAIEAAEQEVPQSEPELRNLLRALLLECTMWDPALTEQGQTLIGAIREPTLGTDIGGSAVRAILAFDESRRGGVRERCIKLARQALAEGDLLRQPAGLIAGLSATFALTLADDFDTAAIAYDDALADARRRGDLVSIVPLLILRGMTALYRGDLRAAEEDLRAPEIEFAQGGSTTAGYRVGFLVELLIERGSMGEAADVLGSVQADEQVHAGYRPLYLCARGDLALARGDHHGALAEFDALGRYAASIGIANPAYAPWRSGKALALLALGSSKEAEELVGEEVELARAWGAGRALGIALGRRGLVEGGDGGVMLLREAAHILESSSASLEYARVLVNLGGALRRHNQRSEAEVHLRAGLEQAHFAGASRLVAMARDELASIGLRPRRAVRTGLEALTPSERRVARMAAEGMSNREIAHALFVSIKAVEVHLTAAYQKLSIRSRAQLPDALRAG